MYNRYVRNERGEYVRVPVVVPPRRDPFPPPPAPPTHPPAELPPPPVSEPPPFAPVPKPPPRPPRPTPPSEMLRLPGWILDRIRLQGVDTGDLLLLAILFLLFTEKADEELLIALGLLLIL